MSKSIRLHPEFGPNPTVTKCSICGADSGVAFLGYNGGKKAPRSSMIPGVVCSTCEEHKKIGIILIEARDGETGANPYRTGRIFVVTEEAFQKFFHGPEVAAGLKSRVVFIQEEVVKALGIDQVEPTMGRIDG